MYTHILHLLTHEDEMDETLNDYVFKHVVYAYSTSIRDTEHKIVDNQFVQQTGVVYFDEADPNNFIPSANVTQEVLKQWVEEKIDIAELQALNLQELSK